MSIERSPSGTQRTLDAALLTFDLAAVLGEMRRERTWAAASRDAITLFKTRGLRVVLVAVHGGTAIPLHRTEGAVTLQVVEGRMAFETAAGRGVLAPGHLLALQPEVPHGLAAIEDCAFLLTIGSETTHPAESRAPGAPRS